MTSEREDREQRDFKDLARTVVADAWQPKASDPGKIPQSRQNFARATADRAELFSRVGFPKSSWGAGTGKGKS